MNDKEILEKLRQKFGDGVVQQFSEQPDVDIETIPTGSIGLDCALGVGGIPKGRFIEIYGPNSSGKTSLCLHLIAEEQKKGGKCAFIDAEHALDLDHASNLGVDIPKLFISQPSTGEEALEVVDEMVRTKNISLIVIDSVAALTPRDEIEGEMGKAQMGKQAKLIGQGLRKLVSAVHSSNTAVVFINQMRENIGVIFGSSETTTGGKALPFFTSIRMDIRRISRIKKGEVDIGCRCKVKVVKNKVAPPFGVAEFDFFFDKGIARGLEAFSLAKDIIKEKKDGYYFKDILLGKREDSVRIFLDENPEVVTQILKELTI